MKSVMKRITTILCCVALIACSLQLGTVEANAADTEASHVGTNTAPQAPVISEANNDKEGSGKIVNILGEGTIWFRTKNTGNEWLEYDANRLYLRFDEPEIVIEAFCEADTLKSEISTYKLTMDTLPEPIVNVAYGSGVVTVTIEARNAQSILWNTDGGNDTSITYYNYNGSFDLYKDTTLQVRANAPGWASTIVTKEIKINDEELPKLPEPVVNVEYAYGEAKVTITADHATSITCNTSELFEGFPSIGDFQYRQHEGDDFVLTEDATLHVLVSAPGWESTETTKEIKVPSKGYIPPFGQIRGYQNGMHRDVSKGVWYYGSVEEAYKLGLMDGNADGTFNPFGSVTIAESMALAARIHNIYNGGNGIFYQGSPWYSVYEEYLIKNGIVEAGEYGNVNKAASRLQFVNIIAKALPSKELEAINSILTIPDVDANAAHVQLVYLLYNAGILNGSDENGSFNPESDVKRSEVATIIVRMINVNARLKTSFDRTVGPVAGEENVGSESRTSTLEESTDSTSQHPNTEMTDGGMVVPSEEANPAMWLCDLDYFDSKGSWIIGKKTKDNLGNEHKHSIDDNQYNTYYTAYRTYKLNQNYSLLTGAFFQEYEFRSQNDSNGGKNKLVIYGDGDDLWTGEVGPGMDPLAFKVDVSKVNELKIEVSGGCGRETALGSVALW